MEKPYDEKFISKLDIPHLIRDGRMLYDWLKFELQADELEIAESHDKYGITVRYKRNEL